PGLGRQRRLAGRRQQGRGLLPPAQAEGQLRPRHRHRRHRQVRPDPGPVRVGLPFHLARQGRLRLEDLRPLERDHRRLLRPGHQQAGSAPRRRSAVGGVPVLRRGPESLAQGRRPARAPGGHDQGGHHRRGRCPEFAARHRNPAVPDAGAADSSRHLRRGALVGGHRLISAGSPAVSTTAARPFGGGRRLPLSWLGVVPFFVYVGIFLVLPSLIIAVGAFASKDGSFTLGNFTEIQQAYLVKSFVNSFLLSLNSALIGAVGGALLAYAVATGNPRGVLRRTVTSASGVLAQFGGVTLAFAFIATIGNVGFLTVFLKDHGIDIYANSAPLYELSGLTIVYAYFQIPLMLLVFLPAVDGIRPQWREATESLGGSTWHYWRYVAGPLLLPSFLGCTLLLFANAFSAYATAAAIITQGGIIVPLQISNLFTSETGRAIPGLAKALALSMILIVTLVVVVYTVLQRRTSRWLR